MRLKIVFSILLLSVSTASYGCGLFNSLFTSERVSLDYVGNIEFKTPNKFVGVTEIPVTFSAGKWASNSAICFNKIESKVETSRILISVITCVCSSKTPNYVIALKNIKAGNYQLLYKNPDNTLVSLGSIEM